jgi:hypothetical protein
MAKTGSDFDNRDGSDCAAAVALAREEDAYWGRSFRRESYYKRGLSYEDYAPAYCVGYVGYVQYGGTFAEAETWLCSNWMRIRSDSRLTLEEALMAIRSAWERMEQRASRAEAVAQSGLRPRRSAVTPFTVGATLAG